MKIKLSAAVALLVAIGFKKAGEWDAEKVTARIKEVPNKVDRADVPEGHEGLYQQLVDSKGDVTLENDVAPGTAASPEKAPKPAKPEKAPKPAKPEKAPKPAKPESVQRDAYGCRDGSISAKVNAALTGEWQSEQEIAEAAGVTLEQARGRLYYGAEEKQGVFEHRRLIQYRLAAKKPVKKEKAS